MPAFTDSIREIIARHLNVSKQQVKVEVLTALPYSLNVVEVIEQTLRDNGVDALNEIDTSQFENNADSLIVCKCLIKDNQRYVALIFDAVELYEPTSVSKLIAY